MEFQEAIDLENLDVEEFLSRNRISTEDWEKANITYDNLLAIGIDHRNQSEQLADTAVLFAKIIQKFEGVHSVRWRIKNPEHLMEKIVRKRTKEEGKYVDISQENYHTVVTDLIGIRALHLFKEDCFIIDTPMRKTWQLEEEPIAYLRDGDQSPITDRLRECKFEIKTHPAGYRSIHYVFSSQPVGRRVITEVQVRTIFEEGWSEIDHNVRYPNFSDNQLVAFFLAIFNRMAGSADEMGAFVRTLINTLKSNEENLASAMREKQETLKEMRKTLQELEDLKQQDATSKDLIEDLRSKLSKLNQSEGPLSQVSNFERSLQALNLGLGPEYVDAARRLAELSKGSNDAISRASALLAKIPKSKP